jgi:polysaccharide export outer membrane protein
MRKAVKQILCCALLVFGVFFAVAVAQENSDARTEALKRADQALRAQQEMPKTSNAAAMQQSQQQTGELNSMLSNRAPDENARKYRIGVGDEIIVEVFKHPEYNAIKRVDERGLISLSRIDKPIQAVCKTENELSAEIVGYYKKYLRQPYVNVYVRDYKSQPVAVMGAVEKGGQFFISREMRLIQAITLAGGPNKEAGSKVLLARMGEVDLCSAQNPTVANTTGEETLKGKFYSYNLRRVMEGDDASNPVVKPGDIVSILESDKAYVIGNVKEQKTILLKEPVTLTQAVAAAGGAQSSSKLKQVFILRQDEQGNKLRLPYDFLAINANNQKDPYLLPNDIVEVPIDPKKSNLETLKKAFINGLPAVIPFLF